MNSTYSLSSAGPSFTKREAKAFLEASRALAKHAGDIKTSRAEAVRTADHPGLRAFVQKIDAWTNASPQEKQAAASVFAGDNLQDTLQEFFRQGEFFDKDPRSSNADAQVSMTKDMLASLLKSVLLGLHSCQALQAEGGIDVVIEGQPQVVSAPPPTKKQKQDDQGHEAVPYQSPSFDSSLATLKDEEAADSTAVHCSASEVDDTARHVAELILSYSQQSKKKKQHMCSIDSIVAWSRTPQGQQAAPWLTYLDSATWERLARMEPLVVGGKDPSPSLVSFDFSDATETPLIVNLTEANLVALQELLATSKLDTVFPKDLCAGILSDNIHATLTREAFAERLALVVPAWKELAAVDRAFVEQNFINVFELFQEISPTEGKATTVTTAVSARGLATGLTFFCRGTKSSKLIQGFEASDVASKGYLTEGELHLFLSSYLTALVGLSQVSRESEPLDAELRQALAAAVAKGTEWSLGHFHEYLKGQNKTGSLPPASYAFNDIASWYTKGGYSVVPWFELLDLSKVATLVEQRESPVPLEAQALITTQRKALVRDRVSTLRRHHSGRRRGPTPEILFAFPLAAQQSLIVLKEDARYVKSVVEQLGLLQKSPESVWSALSVEVQKRQKSPKSEQTVHVDTDTFVKCMKEVCPMLKKQADGDSTDELLSNFFQCFDLDQVNRVTLDELMGGVSLLCGGKKSVKLAFAFTIFDSRPNVRRKKDPTVVHSLGGEDLFLFLRSILIITFSCCHQSLDMSDPEVARCIADTSNMICSDVMRHQWESKKKDRLTFEEFGQWYNEGGYERAPWLELLDLSKWVLAEETLGMGALGVSNEAPPPPPDMDLDLFDDGKLMAMDSIDDMDMILLNPSGDLADPKSPRPKASAAPAPHVSPRATKRLRSLKFQLTTTDTGGGYMLSLSNRRIRHLRRVMEICGSHQADNEAASNAFILKSSKSSDPKLSRDNFRAVVKQIFIKSKKTTAEAKTLVTVLDGVFNAFADKTGKASVYDVACGFTILCHGKKSDKLEHCFDILKKKGRPLVKEDVARFLSSLLTVLLSLSFSDYLHGDADDSISVMDGPQLDRSAKTILAAVTSSSKWASDVAYKASSKKATDKMDFDDFAEWYTSFGYVHIPWLELLDLNKWVFTPDTA